MRRLSNGGGEHEIYLSIGNFYYESNSSRQNCRQRQLQKCSIHIDKSRLSHQDSASPRSCAKQLAGSWQESRRHPLLCKSMPDSEVDMEALESQRHDGLQRETPSQLDRHQFRHQGYLPTPATWIAHFSLSQSCCGIVSPGSPGKLTRGKYCT